MTDSNSFYHAAEQLIAAGRFIDSKGWVPATSGNFSVRLPDGTIAITVSGKHKGRLHSDDIMLIDIDANSLDGKKSSAETGLHTGIYRRFPEINAVLHPHPLNTVLVSKLFGPEIVLENYELLKAFCGIDTHESRIVVPIFANDQDIPRLAAQVDAYLDTHSDCYAYIIAGHGLYTWGTSVEETLRYLEALDFLFACELHLYGAKK
ncbi:MAG: methylthioribulose 1-phosphate dehydratase [Methylovulum sp.]|uniref:methylthioribulose 1-phosphate dehydratase n=1 Tax=Methylovulum sp. TaxID=1916980 RepID=UPI002621AD47|nr:methylthioribulose 1-phosphate dehydratase [Methylovulum sp.]MDD2722391.1 methylthioribulose 1-phosphate dehydratase [Methylovulum sp.]MDD5125764.1 methylthioribulose 1-phosphate dehydratase [Methylovulum sp.]